MEIGSVNYTNFAMKMRSVYQPRVEESQIKSVELTKLQQEIKDQTVQLKSDNDLFGALKTVERSLLALKTMVDSAKNGELDPAEAIVAINERMVATNYKNQNLYEHFPLSDGSTIDIRARLAIGSIDDLDGFRSAVEIATKESSQTLDEVKKRIMSGTTAMASSAQKSIATGNSGVINPADIVANTNVDYLKDQFSKLMR